MATKYVNIIGKAAWAHNLFRLDESPYGKSWNVEVYPTPEGQKVFDEAAISLRPIKKPIFAGETGYKFKRHPEKNGWEYSAPVVVDKDNNPWPNDVAIGNGSLVEINVCVYDTRGGLGPKGHRLQSVKVLEHVPYVRENAPAPSQQQIKTNENKRVPNTPW